MYVGSEGCLIACSTGMDCYHVLATVNVFHLTTLKQILDMYKNDWLHFVYTPLLVGDVDDVENNPGPAVFDNTNLTTSVSAGHKSIN